MALGVDDRFRRTWQSGEHVDDKRPSARVRVQRGLIDRAFQPFVPLPDGTEPAGSWGYIHGGVMNPTPWQGYWRPTGEWIDVPNVGSIELDHSFDNNGVQSAVVSLDSTIYDDTHGEDGHYYAIKRGHLAPWFGYNAFGRPSWGPMNEWFNVLNGGYRIRIDQGFGDDDEDLRVRTFEGIIDDTDTENRPDVVTMTCRNFGAMLTDQRMFGWNKARDIRSPVVFCDRNVAMAKLAKGGKIDKWILVNDPSDVVRWVLMWCGFKEWQVENFGSPLKEPITFHQSDYMIDVIKRIQSYGNFVFYIKPSQSDEEQAIGIPVFRRSNVTATTYEVTEITEDDLLTDMKTKFSKESLPFTITTRGKAVAPPVGTTWGEDTTTRVQAVYFPPWSGANPGGTGLPDTPDNAVFGGRTCGLWKHLVHSDLLLESTSECMMANILIAIALGRQAFTGVIEIPAYPQLELDDHVSVIDTASGANSRLWITKLHSTMRLGRDAEWKETVEGALLDFPDMEVLMGDYAALLASVQAVGGLA